MTPPRRRYRTDLTDAQWQVLGPLIPQPKPGGRPAVHQRRELLNAMLYWRRAGCAWRLLPHDLPPWKTVYHYFRCWRLDRRHLPRLRYGWVDGGYRGAFVAWTLAKFKIAFEVVQRADGGRRRRWLAPRWRRRWFHSSRWSHEGGSWSGHLLGWAAFAA